MSYKAVPLDMISPVNYFAPLPEGRWIVTDPNAVTLWFQLQIEDSLGARRYVVASGSTMSVIFQRAELLTSNQGVLSSTDLNVTVAAVANANDRSLFSVSLTSQAVKSITSGTVKFSLTESGVNTVWAQNYILSKKLTDPGH